MKRREFITVLGGAAATWPLAARAQQTGKIPLIGVLLSSVESDPQAQERLAALRDGLQNIGWANGDNIRLATRWIGGNAARANVYAQELVDLAADVIVANSTLAIEAALRATRTIPTVFVLVGDPVGSGYVASLARPGGNTTGFSAFDPEIVGKWMEALKEIAPAVKQAMVLFYPGYEFLWRGAEAAAATLRLDVTRSLCESAADIEKALAAVAEKSASALIVLPAPLFATNRDLITAAAARYRLPAVYPFRYYAESGGLLSYGIDSIDVFRRAARYIDRILKGENPGDLPVQAPTKFELVVNLKTANALGLVVPPSLLTRADEVIE